ncbi:MAG: peptidylprolyl isomerase [Planctomycetes bacterium]|nr:peptidylprolyl isomerase [Planctomycetota bacterium]
MSRRTSPCQFRAVAPLCCATALLLPLTACHRADRPPPQARRPVIKSQTELAEERQAGIRSGRIRPSAVPLIVDAERQAAEARHRPVPRIAAPGAIQADMLAVNDQVLTVAEILYAIRDEAEEFRAAQTPQGFATWARRTIRDTTRREIGSLLLYDEAVSGLNKQQHDSLDKFVEQRLSDRIAQEFGGRTARLEGHLAEYGLLLATYRDWLRRDVVVSQYTREKFLPKIAISRHELLAAWKRNVDEYTSPARRELYLIEVPFASFLGEGVSWESADEGGKARAKLKALRHVRKISGALESTSFEEVARESSRGLKADEGGAWGFITTPLRAPYDVASKRIFGFVADQVSEPIETEAGWFIAKCGRIEQASTASFVDSQGELRREIENTRLNLLVSNYVADLAGKSGVSAADVGLFVESAVRRISRGPAAGSLIAR